MKYFIHAISIVCIVNFLIFELFSRLVSLIINTVLQESPQWFVGIVIANPCIKIADVQPVKRNIF